mmetsp:Transcript_13959/g.40298  ORF Transcript_13959/g.40298 Transcript_13959/m.40298 type:complete len:90 (-) Transcript_13959:21-290(-)
MPGAWRCTWCSHAPQRCILPSPDRSSDIDSMSQLACPCLATRLGHGGAHGQRLYRKSAFPRTVHDSTDALRELVFSALQVANGPRAADT